VTPSHLYVHVPFCARRCSYCDFAIAVRRDVPMAEFLDALRAELELVRGDGAGPELDTLYLGGGTPSRLGGRGVRDLISLVRRYFTTDELAELTIEANPDDVTADVAAAWREIGVNRVSLGVQSFDDRVLQWMHRTHDSEQVPRAVEALRDAGFENISLDLIFGLPESMERSWESDLSQALRLGPDHISLYGLTVEHATPLARWVESGAIAPAGEDRYARDFLVADELTVAAGFTHYEVSNFARPGKKSRHNTAYWDGSEYLGIGPSAHSFDGETRRWNVAAYRRWAQLLRGGKSVIEGAERLTDENRRAERVYLGLRTSRGLAASARDIDAVRRWTGEGWATMDGDVVRLTPEGWLRLDSLAAGLTGL
jgi:oxygen-independent coproporphyrinogen-3 oxidase